MENFDFFDSISDDMRYYAYFGDVYLCGDMNSRTACLSDSVENLGLDRYVDLPETDEALTSIPERRSFDLSVNAFGHKLISLCKEHDLKIVNGRLEPGRFTYLSSCGASLVDYFITQTKNYSNISSLNVHDLSEFSDHCIIEICFEFALKPNNADTNSYDKITWDSSKRDTLLITLEHKRHLFDEAANLSCANAAEIDTKTKQLTDLMYDACFSVFGKTVTGVNRKVPDVQKKAPWFDEDCRATKASFLNAKRVFRDNTFSTARKESFLEARKKYALAKRKARRKFDQSERARYSNMGKNSPKQFWRTINNLRKGKQTKTQPIGIDEFAEHFKRISNISNITNHAFDPNPNVAQTDIEELDRDISFGEIEKAINSLKRGKSPGFDGILCDFFKDAKTFITPYLLKSYNEIFNSGIYPESWSNGLIVPIHKKGDTSEPNNYRGITLISTYAKIFSLILRNRLNEWCEKEHVFNEFQFGFRNERSTSDCIFILHSLIQKTLNENSKLYCAFVDYEKAFDTVKRDALWFKLMDSGISCKMIRIIKSLYGKVFAAVKLNAKVSDYFEVSLGVKQGEPLSPLLFILFINDVHADLIGDNDDSVVNGLTITQICIILLLFADDMVLFSKDPDELQLLLNKLHVYSCEWGLKVNTAKTKILVFHKRRMNIDFIWIYNGENLEIVESFSYLGMKFHYTGNLEPGVKALSDQALRATNCLLSLFKRVSLDLKTKISLFDSLVTPILLYGSEVWGVQGFDCIDKVHIKFLKMLLGVRPQTPNYAVYGELGRFPLSVISKERAVKFWLKLLKNPESLTY